MNSRAHSRAVRRLHASVADASGAAAAEFALILPLILVLLFGFFEAGRMFWTYNIVSGSARDAARYAARLQIDCETDTVSDEDKVKNLAVTGQVTGGNPLVPGWEVDDIEVSVVCQPIGAFDGRYTGMTEIPTVTVSATAPFQTLWGSLFPGLTISQITVSNSQVWTE